MWKNRYDIIELFFRDPSRKNVQDKKTMTEKDKKDKLNEKNHLGSWGPVFKNRENFNEMHFC